MTAKWMLSRATVLCIAGLTIGVIAGWVGLIREDGALEIAIATEPFGYALIGAVPLALFLPALRAPSGAEASAKLGPLIGAMFIVAVGGAVAACALFVVAAVQIPGVFAGESSELLMRATRAGFGWTKLIIVVAATTVCAVPAAWVIFRRAWGARQAGK